MASELTIIGVHKSLSDPTKEYLVLKVLEDDVDLGEYAIFDKTYSNGTASNINPHFYRFESKIVKKDSFVILATGTGSYSFGKIDTLTGHLFYSGTPSPHWNKTGDTITLIKYEKVDSKKLDYIK